MVNLTSSVYRSIPQRRSCSNSNGLGTFDVLGVPVSAITLTSAIALVGSWIGRSERPKLATFTNVHMLTESHLRPEIHTLLKKSDLNCPDGMPLVWIGKLRLRRLTQVCGTEFMEKFCAATAEADFRHFFYGGAEGVALSVISELQVRHRSLKIAGSFSPPFRKLTCEEDEQIVQHINDSGADVIWVSLGCPKQEIWMYEHRDRLRASVILSVGQAFDILAGVKRRVPVNMRSLGLEWLYRAFQEPKRLLCRYVTSNPVFLFLLLMALFKKSNR